MDIELKYAENFVRFLDVTLPKARNSKYPQETDFYIYVKSGGFYGSVGTFVLYTEFDDFLSDIKKLYNFEIEKATFKTAYGDEINISMNKQGQIVVSGVIIEPIDGQRLIFEFAADQSSLPLFIHELENLVNN